jgi:hypothetical protein
MTARRISEARRWVERTLERRRPREREWWITSHSVHEGAHAVAHSVLEQPFKYVALRFSKKTFGHLIYNPPFDTVHRAPDDPVVTEYNEHVLIIGYAGGAAERLFFPNDANKYGDKGDVREAERILRRLRPDKKERDAYRQHCRDEAWKLVNKHRRKIEKVAAALERWRILTDVEISWLINKPRVFAQHERDWPRVRREPEWHDIPGWRRLDRSHAWQEEREQRESDRYFNEETGDYYG